MRRKGIFYFTCCYIVTVMWFLTSVNSCISQSLKVEMVTSDYTLLLENNDIVKLLGLQLPKVLDYRKPVSYLHEEVLSVMKLLLTDRDIKLEYETVNTDYLGNKIAYVFIEGVDYFVNAELIRMGYASVTDEYDFKLREDFITIEKKAIEKKRGLWREIKELKAPVAGVAEAGENDQEVSLDDSTETFGFEGADLEGLLNASGFNLSKLGLSSRDLKNAIEGMGINPEDLKLNQKNMEKLQKGKGKGKGQMKNNPLDMNTMFEMMSGGTAEKSDQLDIVYINPGENIYHRQGCKLIKNGAKSMIKLHAKLTYNPCSVCKPQSKK